MCVRVCVSVYELGTEKVCLDGTGGIIDVWAESHMIQAPKVYGYMVHFEKTWRHDEQTAAIVH